MNTWKNTGVTKKVDIKSFLKLAYSGQKMAIVQADNCTELAYVDFGLKLDEGKEYTKGTITEKVLRKDYATITIWVLTEVEKPIEAVSIFKCKQIITLLMEAALGNTDLNVRGTLHRLPKDIQEKVREALEEIRLKKVVDILDKWGGL